MWLQSPSRNLAFNYCEINRPKKVGIDSQEPVELIFFEIEFHEHLMIPQLRYNILY